MRTTDVHIYLEDIDNTGPMFLTGYIRLIAFADSWKTGPHPKYLEK